MFLKHFGSIDPWTITVKFSGKLSAAKFEWPIILNVDKFAAKSILGANPIKQFKPLAGVK